MCLLLLVGFKSLSKVKMFPNWKINVLHILVNQCWFIYDLLNDIIFFWKVIWITLEFMIWYVGNVQNNISPSNTFLNCFCLQNLIKIVSLFLAAVSINGLIHELSILVPDVPGQPGQPEVTDLKAAGGSLSWKAPEDDGNTPITNYIIEGKAASEFTWSVLNRYEKCPTTHFQLKNLKEDVDYEFRVTAENKVGAGPPSRCSEPVKFCEYPYSWYSPWAWSWNVTFLIVSQATKANIIIAPYNFL